MVRQYIRINSKLRFPCTNNGYVLLLIKFSKTWKLFKWAMNKVLLLKSFSRAMSILDILVSTISYHRIKEENGIIFKLLNAIIKAIKKGSKIRIRNNFYSKRNSVIKINIQR